MAARWLDVPRAVKCRGNERGEVLHVLQHVKLLLHTVVRNGQSLDHGERAATTRCLSLDRGAGACHRTTHDKKADKSGAANVTSLMTVIPGKSSPGTAACASSGLAPFEPAGPCNACPCRGMRMVYVSILRTMGDADKCGLIEASVRRSSRGPRVICRSWLLAGIKLATKSRSQSKADVCRVLSEYYEAPCTMPCAQKVY